MLSSSEIDKLIQRITAQVERVIHEEIAAWQREQNPATLGDAWPALPDLDDAYEPDFEDDDPNETDERKYKTSEARRLRLAENKRQSRRRKVEYERKAEAAATPKTQPTLDELIAELKRQSMGTGVMPSAATFDVARPGNWTTGAAHRQRLGISWNELADKAGLRVRPSRHMQEA